MIAWKKIEDGFPVPTRTTEKITAEKIDTFIDPYTENMVKLLCLSDQSSFIQVESESAKLWNIDYHRPKPFILFDHYQNEITSAGLDPSQPNVFAFADDSGDVKLFDMGSNTIINSFSTPQFGDPQYSDLSVTSVKFKPSGTLFATRTFTHLQVWDTRNNAKPLAVQEVQNYPERGNYVRVGDYSHDSFGSLFLSTDEIYSGTFGHVFVSWDWKSSVLIKHKASRRSTGMNESTVDFTKKVSRITVNHGSTILGVASTASLFFYQLN
ncbi:protein phosphatase PP2A regulatory subunit B [Tritrichomonas foetus]|uniref:Protein phosphatase PP2A regulatory subunit B n=1 Tax=Tritrichomonas foetus TaxID=1144522 RepID=A0A1J4KBG6_9EUKA|nr:protein phosphatase PP2A regulatory subunit B [Tritrichomonas foetus]|eukprot:OHT08751.1 protein phosphatase PP2A regulatory subunit B [Tritrichomonas foetus]